MNYSNLSFWQLKHPRVLVAMVDWGHAGLQALLLPSTLTINDLQHILPLILANVYANHVQSPVMSFTEHSWKQCSNEDIIFTRGEEEAEVGGGNGIGGWEGKLQGFNSAPHFFRERQRVNQHGKELAPRAVHFWKQQTINMCLGCFLLL